MPKRIQRKRSKGWKMPENTKYVGRPSKWGNPYKVTTRLSLEKSLQMYEELFTYSEERINQVKEELRGKDLACFCSLDQKCHADILLKIANT